MIFSKPAFVNSIASTNDTVRKKAEEGCKQGFVLVAGKQTKGKGTRQRKWFSPKGGLWFSFLLRNEKNADLLPVIASIAVSKTLKNIIEKEIRIKWLNDIYYKNKKIAGILCESFFSGKKSFTVIGIGINSNVSRFPKTISNKSTSLLIETGKKVDNREVLDDFLQQFLRAKKKSRKELWESYAKRNLALGKEALLNNGKKGIVKEIDKEFKLVINIRGKNVKACFNDVKKIKKE